MAKITNISLIIKLLTGTGAAFLLRLFFFLIKRRIIVAKKAAIVPVRKTTCQSLEHIKFHTISLKRLCSSFEKIKLHANQFFEKDLIKAQNTNQLCKFSKLGFVDSV